MGTYCSARAVDLSIVLGVEVEDLEQRGLDMRAWECSSLSTNLDLSATIMLDDLVRSVVGASTDNSGHISRAVIFLGDSQLSTKSKVH